MNGVGCGDPNSRTNMFKLCATKKSYLEVETRWFFPLAWAWRFREGEEEEERWVCVCVVIAVVIIVAVVIK